MGNSRFFHAILYILIAITFFLAFTSLVGFFSYLKPPKITSNITPNNLNLQYEDGIFTTTDNVTLRGWFIPHKQERTKKTIIVLHGWPADKGNVLPAISFLAKEYNLFLFDFRALGQSEGSYSTVGVRETEDFKAALRYLKTKDITEVGVWGFSMGGAVALMTAPTTPEIRAVVSEASYARLGLMASEVYQIPMLNHPLGWFTGVWAKVFLGVDIQKASPVDSAKDLNIPVLLIHSTNDEVIPFSHAQRLQRALEHNPKAEFWFQENLSHGQFSKQYQSRILDFFQKNL